MIRNMTLTVMLIAGCVWCVALVSRADSAQDSGHNHFKPAMSVHQMMEGQLIVFKQLNEAVKNKSTDDRTELIEGLASVIAELANVNSVHSDKSDYIGWASDLRNTSMELAEEAEKKKDANDQRMEKLLTKMKQSCVSCHDVYQEDE